MREFRAERKCGVHVLRIVVATVVSARDLLAAGVASLAMGVCGAADVGQPASAATTVSGGVAPANHAQGAEVLKGVPVEEGPSAAGPVVVQGFEVGVDSARVGRDAPMVEGIAAPLPSEAVVLSQALGGAAIAAGRIAPAKGGGAWSIVIQNKTVATISQKGRRLLIRALPADRELLLLLQHFVVEVRSDPTAAPLAVPLGRPLHALLDVRLAGGKPEGGEAGAEVFSEGGRYSLFGEEAVVKRVAELLVVVPGLYESLEFDPSDGVTSQSVDRGGRVAVGAFSIADAQGRGVLLRRAGANPPAYRKVGLAFPLRYGRYNEAFASMSVFDEALLREIPQALKRDIAEAEQASFRSFEAGRRAEALRDAGAEDQRSLAVAGAFPLAAAQGRRVRLTLKLPGKPGGFVAVDSLGPAPNVVSSTRSVP